MTGNGVHRDSNGSTHLLPVEPQVPVYDWEAERRKYKTHQVYDDGTMTYLWRYHRTTVLVLFSCVLAYIAIFEPVHQDTEYNTKRGLVAMVLTFVLAGVTITPDGPFRRPHPAFWRLIMCLSIVYQLAIVFLLFQTADDARALLKNLDPSLGVPLPEKEYGGNCILYDANHTDPFHNIKDKLDGFVPVHFFGWWLKTLILRDYWLCMVFSIMFEVLEYTLEHQLPNFSECWWDHWVMDIIICNGFGIYLGMKTLNYLSMKPYHWRGMWNIPSYRGKFTRILKQFTPYSWTDFDWAPTSSLKRWVLMLFLITMFLIAELNTFYLKFVLWIPPPHWLCLGRLFFFLFMGAVALREMFQFLDDPHTKGIGRQSWIIASIIISELLLSMKFDLVTITKPLPRHIAILWIVGLSVLVLWTIWHFYFKRLLWHTERKIKDEERRFSRPNTPTKHNQAAGTARQRHHRATNNNTKS